MKFSTEHLSWCVCNLENHYLIKFRPIRQINDEEAMVGFEMQFLF